VDANGGYTTGQAVRVGRQLAGYGVTWFEEPVSSQDLAGLAAVRRQVTPDVTAGEYSWSLADSRALIEAGAVDCLQLDVTRHCAPSLHAQAAVAAPNLRHVEYFHDHQRIEAMLFDGVLSPEGGLLTPDAGRPGLGMTLRQADAERFRQA
jgi:L-alanine-DL-glutamate epimerase-like enolase superfamily enzyme